MKIHPLNKSAKSNFDFKAFSEELRELSQRHGVQIVSLGAMSGLDVGGNGTTWMAIWQSGNGDDLGN